MFLDPSVVPPVQVEQHDLNILKRNLKANQDFGTNLHIKTSPNKQKTSFSPYFEKKDKINDERNALFLEEK